MLYFELSPKTCGALAHKHLSALRFSLRYMKGLPIGTSEIQGYFKELENLEEVVKKDPFRS